LLPVDNKLFRGYVARLRLAEKLDFAFPQWWFNVPAILKGFFDLVFVPGVARHLTFGLTHRSVGLSRLAMRSALSSQLVRAFFVVLTMAYPLPIQRPAAMAESGVPSPRVTVARPIAKTIDVWDEYTGRFEALKQVEVRARVSGTLDKINFTDGQLVKEGDLLFVIDPRPYQIAVDSAKADGTKAQAQVALAATDAGRAQQLAESRSITSREVDQRKANLDVTRAQQLAAEAALRNAELNLEWTQVRAPISGRVSDRRVDAGNLIQGGQTGATLLTTIVTLDPIHFVFDASEADYLRYAHLSAQGQRASSRDVKNPVTVRLADENEWKHAGVMDFVDNQLNARSGTIRGRAIFDNKDLFLLPGTFGHLRLFGGKVAALLIPDSAIVSDQASKVVFTVTPENKIAVKQVQLGQIHEGLRVVLSGLAQNDQVVIDGLANPFVRPGVLVTPQDGIIAATAN
jgi:RND family efflux transporter MFP subunit